MGKVKEGTKKQVIENYLFTSPWGILRTNHKDVAQKHYLGVSFVRFYN